MSDLAILAPLEYLHPRQVNESHMNVEKHAVKLCLQDRMPAPPPARYSKPIGVKVGSPEH
jgi:hypothetical protein